MEYQDKILKCMDCGTDFVFTAGEQLFFHDKQFKNEPKRCKNCKGKRVAVLGATSQRPGRTARSAAKTRRYRSGRRKGVRYCAGSAFSTDDRLRAPDYFLIRR